MAHHISVFMENRPGKLERISKLLSGNEINIRAMSMASSGDFGIIKLLVDQPFKAQEILKQNRISVSLREILLTVVTDKPGSLATLLSILSEKNINIEDAYGFVLGRGNEAAIVLETGDNPVIGSYLQEKGYRILGDEEVYQI